MLYISRFVGRDQYGVVDTDDGVEEIVPRRILGEALGDYNIDIAGVAYSVTTDEYRFIRSIVPYQDVGTMTSLQVKTNFLYNVEVKLYNNTLVNVLWRADKITSPVTVRLSDFSSVCADRIFFGNVDSALGKVTLVFDDTISWSEFTFVTPLKFLGKKCGLGVNLDVRLLCNDTARLFYNALAKSISSSEIRETVIDSKSRQEAILCGCQINATWWC